jgi:hypothetical protein
MEDFDKMVPTYDNLDLLLEIVFFSEVKISPTLVTLNVATRVASVDVASIRGDRMCLRKIAQDVAKPIFCQNECPALTAEKNSPKNLGYSNNLEKNLPK